MFSCLPTPVVGYLNRKYPNKCTFIPTIQIFDVFSLGIIVFRATRHKNLFRWKFDFQFKLMPRNDENFTSTTFN